MTVPSHVADAAIADIRTVLEAIDTPTARRADPAELAYDAPAIATTIGAAIREVPDARIGALSRVEFARDPIPSTTASRRHAARNRTAIDDFLRRSAAVESARRTAGASFVSRTAAVAARDAATVTLESAQETADDVAYRALRGLHAAVSRHVALLLPDLPSVTVRAPEAVLPALVVAWQVYRDLGRDAEVAERNALPRPGFVPSRPLELLSP